MLKNETALQPIQVPSLQEAAIERIKQYIIAAGLKDGDRLPPEEQLAQQLGISRTVVREALRAMEALGIVTVRKGAGRYVRGFTFDPILDNLAYGMLYDFHAFEEFLRVRERLESCFLADAIANLTPNTIERLQSIVQRMREKAESSSSTDELMDEDISFHRTLYESLGNSFLLKLLETFWQVQKNLRQRYPGGMDTLEERGEFVERHQALLEALARRDVALARERLQEHFEGVHKWLSVQQKMSEKQSEK